MRREELLEIIKKTRRDLSGLLFHFTRTREPGAGHSPLLPNHQTIGSPMPALSVLVEILYSKCLVGTSGYIRGGHRCISFTEWPVSELPALFAMNEAITASGGQPRYEPYGIAVKKDWLFSQGGRPVIYQKDSEYEQISSEHRWRHVRYEPPTIDFTWEREWRIRTDRLGIDPQSILVLVKTAKEAYNITYGFSRLSQRLNQESGNPETASDPSWMAVSLDLFM